MQTIAFHSYKGGVGRTMALANFGVVLAKRGHKVVVLDLDIDAPGIHMKFDLGNFNEGFLEYLRECYSEAREQESRGPVRPADAVVSTKRKTASLRRRAYQPADTDGSLNGNLLIIPAGSRDPTRYWDLLGSSSWIYKIFSPPVSDSRASALQIRVLRDQRDVIAGLFKGGAEYLLIDCKSAGACSRYILSNWADIIVAMFPANPEGVYGAVQSAILAKVGKHADVALVPVLCRVPETLPGATESEFVTKFKDRLKRSFGDAHIGDVSESLEVLHEYRELEVNERILFVGTDGKPRPDPVVLSHDYAKLFHRVFHKSPRREDFGDLVDWKEKLGLEREAQVFEQVFKWVHNGSLINPDDEERNVALRTKTVQGLMKNLASLGAVSGELSGQLTEYRENMYHQAGLDIGRDFGQGRTGAQTSPADTTLLRAAITRWCSFDSECGFGLMKYEPATGVASHTITWTDNFLAPEDPGQGDLQPSGLPGYIRRFAEGYIQGVLERLMGLEYGSLNVGWSDVEPPGFKFRFPEPTIAVGPGAQ